MQIYININTITMIITKSAQNCFIVSKQKLDSGKKNKKKKQTDLASCVKAIPQCQLQKCHVEMCCDKEIQLKGCPETQAATLVWKKKLCPAIKWFIITTVAWI